MTTEMSSVGILQADGRVAREPTMDVAHVVAAIVYMAELPLDANVLNLTITPTKMPFVGPGLERFSRGSKGLRKSG